MQRLQQTRDLLVRQPPFSLLPGSRLPLPAYDGLTVGNKFFVATEDGLHVTGNILSGSFLKVPAFKRRIQRLALLESHSLLVTLGGKQCFVRTRPASVIDSFDKSLDRLNVKLENTRSATTFSLGEIRGEFYLLASVPRKLVLYRHSVPDGFVFVKVRLGLPSVPVFLRLPLMPI